VRRLLFLCFQERNVVTNFHMQVVRCYVYAEQSPWERITVGGAPHHHAFIHSGNVVRFCSVSQTRGQPLHFSAGLKGLKLLKTTQSGFEGFYRDSYTTLPEVRDRTFCTSVFCEYTFSEIPMGVDYSVVWESVKTAILDVFAGPPHQGTYSPSVQVCLCVHLL
jgi:urate oxidase